ncbi:MAG TPA: rRNA maturation RNase YbeY [Candidatus Sulfomarinibacteraceae bacterium]|nr:rRNA maturation RNase YbeY [Candidatus Sulfomarinibacteraceae bacterium]
MSSAQYHVDVQVAAELEDASAGDVREAALAVLRHQNVQAPAELSILLTDSESVRQLNRTYRERDEATDVLSFPSGEMMPGAEHYLGDVAIAIPVARAQAARSGHELQAELALLTIHGILHLLGYDHAIPDEKEQMWQVQEEVLSQLGLHVIPTEE